MRKAMLGSLPLWLTASCLAQRICPKHIETPTYPPTAHIARAQAKVTLKVTIDAEGNVARAEVADDLAHQANPVLQKAAIDNVQKWTFEKPMTAPIAQIIVYDYKLDPSLPLISNHQNRITKVNLDLPDRVTILGNEAALQPDKTKRKQDRSSLVVTPR